MTLILVNRYTETNEAATVAKQLSCLLELIEIAIR
jgi:hypothetical protein